MANIFEYLTTLPVGTLDSLYTNRWIVQAVFRALPPLGQQYVVRLLCVEGTFSASALASWVRPDVESVHRRIVQRLVALRVLIDLTKEKKVMGRATVLYRLNPVFQTQLQATLTKAEDSPFVSAHVEEDRHKPSPEFLATYSQERWEHILHFMVGSQVQISPGVVDLLVRTKLMQLEGEDSLRITNDGFQFLLRDFVTQIWLFLHEYIETAQERRLERDEVLAFLLELDFLTPCKGYPTEPLSPTQRALIKDLRDFGLVYQRKDSSRYFYPTRVATSLCSAAVHAEREAEGWIVVETNFKVYAYTSSSLQIALLSLFCAMQYRLPNLATGTITRESVRNALLNGIRAEQIIQFLSKNAHPQMRKQVPVVSSNVTDQIRLWEVERNRVDFSDGYLYEQFSSLEEFKKVVQYAEDMSVLLWHSSEDRILVVSEDGHDAVRTFARRLQKGETT